MDTVKLEAEEKTVEMALQEDGSVRISDGQQVIFLERTSLGVTAKDAEGHVAYRAIKGVGDVVTVYDASGNMVRQSGI